MPPRLCANCQKVPLDPNLKTLCSDDYPGPFQWDLGTFGAVRRRECPFCKLVVSISKKSVWSWDPIEPPEDSKAVKLRFERNYGFHLAGFASPLGTYICIATDPMNSEEWKQSGVYRVRETLTQWIDLDDVLRWISTCDREHGPKCATQTYNPAVLPRNSKRQLDFRLIDVHDMCIIYAPRRCRYIALSYVWGNAQDGRLLLNHKNEDLLMQSGALSKAQASIPNTIFDAMALVHGLQERYLWVDSLCLLQDDADELQECTAIMDLFYEMAIFTIVAANGTDAHSGLQGMSPRSRPVSRSVREVVPGLRLTTTVSVDTPLRVSLYSTRAWT
jgi:hypothetical protein